MSKYAEEMKKRLYEWNELYYSIKKLCNYEGTE